MSETRFTGERLHEDLSLFGLDLARHRAAYEFARERVTGARVLDLGCGSGAGTALLASAASRVLGIDRVAPDPSSRVGGASYCRADIAALPLRARRFDAVVSFQVIEHLTDPAPYLRAIGELLRDGGTALLSTPNRRLSDGVNPYHVREYLCAELRDVLARHFAEVEVLGVGMSEPVRSHLAARSRPDPPRDAARPASAARSPAARVGRVVVRAGRALRAPRGCARRGHPERQLARLPDRARRRRDEPRLARGVPGSTLMAVATVVSVPDRDARCPVCGEPASRLRYVITRFRIYDCARCTLVYLWPQISDDEVRELFDRLYTEGEGSVPELATYYDFTYTDTPDNPLVRLYERWLDAVERERPPGRLLDIGCGTGLFLAVARRRGWQPYGVDDCGAATAHARDHFGLEVWDGQFTDFAAEKGLRFDAITMWDIIEHSRAPVDLLAAARDVLAPGGVIGISTPNQRSILDVVAGLLYRVSGGRLTRPLEKFYIEQHFLYFSPHTLRDALGRASLDLVHLDRELTELRRLSLSLAERLVLETLFAAARLTGLENRLFAIARAR